MLGSAALLASGAVALAMAMPRDGADAFSVERERMVRDQIEHRGVHHPGVLRTMRAIPRHLFVPQGDQSLAYGDHPLPIGFGATISQPYIVGLMSEMLDPSSSHRVLEVGTGSGYQAAILAPLVRHVYTIEIVPELVRSARENLRRVGLSNISVRCGDGYAGWIEEAPFDRIIVTAAPAEIPRALIDQLAPEGKLVAPVGSGWGQKLVLIEKSPDGEIRRTTGTPVLFVPMRSGNP